MRLAALACAFALPGAAAPVQGQCTGPSPPCQGLNETCCEDATGWECCIDVSTFCVAPRGTFQTSTCCPRWTIGCTVGSVGCCDPARPWQLFAGAQQRSGIRRPGKRSALASGGVVAEPALAAHAKGSQEAYALFTDAGGIMSEAMTAFTLDVRSGNVTAKNAVTGPAKDYYANYYGESTRVFPWDALGARFVFADADQAKDAKSPMTVYTIDPATGKSTAKRVQGLSGYPMGMAWDAASNALLLGTQTGGEATFCHVDPDTGAATLLGKVPRGKDETSPAFYSAFISLAEKGIAYRVGHQQVSTGLGPGVGVTNTGSRSSEWKGAAVTADHGMPVSTKRHPLRSGAFLSLNPKNSGGGLDVLVWDMGAGAPTVAASLGNAYVPKSVAGELGYVEGVADGAVFAAVAVQRHASPFLPGLLDKWAIATVDLTTNTTTNQAISPQPNFMGANAASLAGFGLKATSGDVVV